MSPERWKQVETLFEGAVDLSAPEQQSFLQTIPDDELRREVGLMLRADEEAGSFLDQSDQLFSAEDWIKDQFPPGEKIDRYRVVREIGRGGMGAVFLAERADEQFQQRVALKVIKRGMDTDSVLRRFFNERQILSGFNHPNIARLFDGGTTESGLPYFAMEYVEGVPVDEYCKTHALSIPQRLKLFREICAAVAYAHQHLVIHRDLKRSNILVTSEAVPKLLDFGIAKILHEGTDPLVTITGPRAMTPETASPEQLRGEAVTTATDVYSLGVVLYELLTGASPYRFESQSPPEIERAITEQVPERPSTVVRNSRIGSNRNGLQDSADSAVTLHDSRALRGDLDTIILMALRKEPERRYSSVEQFSEDLRRYLESRPVLARKDTLGYRAGKFVRRNKLSLAAAALVLISLIAGIIATAREAHIAHLQQARAERRFNEVRKLANSVLFDYHDAIKSLPGATKVRERLVKDGLAYLDSLAAEAHRDPALQRELASAYERVGDVRGGDSTGNLGDVAGAVESYTKALKLREALLAMTPHDVQARRDVTSIHQKLGFRLLRTDQASTGAEYLQQALASYLELIREEPANEELQYEVANARNRWGEALRLRGDLVSALQQYRSALPVLEKLAASHPREQKYRRELWTTYVHIAALLWSQNDVAGTREVSDKVLAMGEALVAEYPNNADYLHSLVVNYENAGDYHRDDNRSGLAYFRKAAALDERLLAVDPVNALTRNDLVYTYKRIADFLADLGDNPEALLHLRKAVEIAQHLVADAPADLVPRFRLATCRAFTAAIQARLGEVNPALEECRKAMTLLEQTSEDATSFWQRTLRAEAYEYLGYAYGELATSSRVSAAESAQHLRTSRDMFQRCLNVLGDSRSRGKLGANDEEWARKMAKEIAKCDAALGTQSSSAVRPGE